MKRVNTAQAIGAFLVSREGRDCSDRTITWYREMLRPLAEAHTTLPREAWQLDATLAAIRRRTTKRKRPPAAATYLGHWKATRIFFRWMRRHHAWTDLYEDMETPNRHRKLPKALTNDQVDRLLAANHHHQRDYVILQTLLDTGVRVGELWSVAKEHIITGQQPHDCRLRVDGKTGEHLVPANADTIRLIARLPYHDRWIWTSLTHPGRRLAVNGLQQAVQRAFARAGMRGGPHVLRHTFGTHFISNGGSVLVLQQIMGHSNIKTTQVYIELAAQQTGDEHARYSPISQRLRLVADNSAAQAAGAS